MRATPCYYATCDEWRMNDDGDSRFLGGRFAVSFGILVGWRHRNRLRNAPGVRTGRGWRATTTGEKRLARSVVSRHGRPGRAVQRHLASSFRTTWGRRSVSSPRLPLTRTEVDPARSPSDGARRTVEPSGVSTAETDRSELSHNLVRALSVSSIGLDTTSSIWGSLPPGLKFISGRDRTRVPIDGASSPRAPGIHGRFVTSSGHVPKPPAGARRVTRIV